MTSPDTILIADHDRAFCAALGAALRRRGFGIVVAHDHEDALAEAGAWRPARAIVDLLMPGHGGLELLAALRTKFPTTKVVVLTRYGSIATAVEAIKLGAIHYLTKPAEADEVIAAFARTQPVLQLTAATTPPSLEQVAWEHLQKVLTDCCGNISEAARRLGMQRRSLQRKLGRGRPEREPEP